MSLGWRKCFLCNGFGELTIGRNYSLLLDLKQEDKPCPMCKGRGSIYLRAMPFEPWRKEKR